MHKWERRTQTYQNKKEGHFDNKIKILVHAQDSCACTTLLCMHNTLVHALEEPGPKAGTQKKSAAGPARGGCFCLGPGIGPWPLQCMHKTVVHAQDCCACTGILCMHNNLDSFERISDFSWYVLVSLFHLCIIHLLCLHNNKYCSAAFFPQRSDFLVHLTYVVD